MLFCCLAYWIALKNRNWFRLTGNTEARVGLALIIYGFSWNYKTTYYDYLRENCYIHHQ